MTLWLKPVRAFSLSELLISILILSTLSVLLVGVIPASVIGLKAAGQRATASQLARQILEDLQRDGFGQLGAVGSSRTLATRNLNGTEYIPTIKIEVAQDSDLQVMDDALARTVEIQVQWRSHVGNFDSQSEKQYSARLTFYRQF